MHDIVILRELQDILHSRLRPGYMHDRKKAERKFKLIAGLENELHVHLGYKVNLDEVFARIIIILEENNG